MITSLIIASISSILLTLGLIFFGSYIYRYFGLLDNPKKYGYKRPPVPYSLGVVFFINFFILSYFFLEPSFKLTLVLFFGFFVTLISFLDDFYDISPKLRLLFQICIGTFVAISTVKIGYISSIFGGVIDLQTYYFMLFHTKIYIIPLIFTVFWFVIIFNALNWSDGIPGLASGMSFLSFLIVFLLGIKLYYTDDYVGGIKNAEFTIFATCILLCSVGVFHFFDRTPKALMGDSGTMFLGFMLAVVTIVSGGKVATVAVVFGVYLIDFFYVIFRRIASGKSPLHKDFTHIHHRLLSAGLAHKQIMTLLFSITLFFGLASLLLDRVGKIFVFGILFFLVIFINVIVDKIHKKKEYEI